ncbi:hypothetical protein QPK87_19490 [Kamptonema cortianum]|nr:hypothetical protein [Geitlerinema splendidum]MDK3158741.1 hypothetical protein [Kamptonema cortianum]
MKTLTQSEVKAYVDQAIERAVVKAGSTEAVKPSHREVFHWPPHAISYDYHVTPQQWTERTTIEVRGELLDVDLAHTEHGVFGRVENLWNEALADSVDEVLEALVEGCEPWFNRMDAVTEALGRTERYHGHFDDFHAGELVSLLYCTDRDVAHTALVEIEKHASSGVFLEAFLAILNDNRHPYRRSAQWCVLDMLEDVNAFAKTLEDRERIVHAIKNLMWDAPDDYARAIFKAGVVLGGHISDGIAADDLLALFHAPSKFGRVSAVHAVFHLCEWLPEKKDQVLAALEELIGREENLEIKEFAQCMAQDIASGATDHVPEPRFDES